MNRFTTFIAMILAVNMTATGMVRAEATPPAAAPGAPAKDAAKTDVPQDAPKIHVDKMEYDFGEVSGVNKVEGKFVITNTGGGVLELQQPKPTCGCTVTKLSKDKLAKGESSELPFTMNINPAHGGVMEKFIGLSSNDPLNGSIRLGLKVNVKPIFSIEPTVINLGDMQAGQTTNAVITITRLDDKPLDFKEHSASDGITVRIEPVAESNGKSVRMHAEFKAAGSPRRFNESINLFTKDTAINQPIASVYLSGRVTGEIVVTPERLFWGVNDPANWPGPRGATMAKRSVRISRSTPANGQPLEIKSAKTNLENIKISITPKEEGKLYEIEMTLEKAPTETIKGTLTIETNIESTPKLEVPIDINLMTRRTPATVVRPIPQPQPKPQTGTE